MKKVKRLLAVLLSMVFVFALTACGGDKKAADGELPEKINIGVQQMPNDDTIAKSQGIFDKYFTDQGIEVNYVSFDSGADVNTALASGDIDFGLMGTSPAAIALSLGIDCEMIWIHEVLGDIESLAVKTDAGIKSLEDLKGKKVAVPVGSTAHYSLLNALSGAGIEADVEILDMQPTDIVAAWSRGDIEAAYVWQPQLQNLLDDGGEILISSEDMAAEGCVTANVEVVSKKFSEAYPDLVVDYIKACSEAADMYRSNPDEAAEIVAEALEIDVENAKTQMEGSIWLTLDEMTSADYFGTAEEPGKLATIMKETADFLQEQKSIEEAPDQEAYNAYVNGSYIEQAKAELAE